jgi:hypothetical protein
VFYALEDRSECVLIIRNGLGRLGKLGITVSAGIDWMKTKVLTERRTPIPVKITAAGWDTCMSIKISDPERLYN